MKLLKKVESVWEQQKAEDYVSFSKNSDGSLTIHFRTGKYHDIFNKLELDKSEVEKLEIEVQLAK